MDTANTPTFLLLGVDEAWFSGLGHAIAQYYRTHFVRVAGRHTFTKYRNLHRATRGTDLLHPRLVYLPEELCHPRLCRKFCVYQRWLVRWLAAEACRNAAEPPLILFTQPYYFDWVPRRLRSRIIYYVVDDYSLYFKGAAETMAQLEADILREAKLVLCSSAQRKRDLAAACPYAAHKLHHFPHAIREDSINQAAYTPPADNVIGYIGTLGDRVDWELADAVVARLPHKEFVFYGRFTGGVGGSNRLGGWQAVREKVFSRPNVRCLGSIPQDEAYRRYLTFGMTWMPYDTTHAFNHAASPTKIMDGIATGRPVLATDLPETRLYPKHLHIFKSPEEAVRLVDHHDRLPEKEKQDLYHQKIAFARANTFAARRRSLEEILEKESAGVLEKAA